VALHLHGPVAFCDWNDAADVLTMKSQNAEGIGAEALWLGSLVRSRSAARVETALDAVLLTSGYLELPAGNAALAAAEVVCPASRFLDTFGPE
jgi:hypothetical protein